MNEQFILILCGLAGVLFHSFAKLQGLLKDARAGNVDFNWKKDYVIKDAPSIALSFLSVGIWFLIFGEITAKYPGLVGFTRTSFVVMGAIGSYAIQLGLGRAKTTIRNVVDKKTDIADNKTT
jgi:hypothetical protein